MSKKLKFTAHPSLESLTFTQYMHDPRVKAVRVNGHITEAFKTKDNTKMSDHFSVWLWLEEILGKFAKFYFSVGISKKKKKKKNSNTKTVSIEHRISRA